MNMFPARLCLCVFLLATCSARPNWHKGFIKKNNILQQNEVINQDKQIHIETTNIEYGKIRPVRQAINPFLWNDGHVVSEVSKLKNHQREFFGLENFGPPLEHQPFQPQAGLRPIEKLASDIQDIIKDHLEQTVQLNKEIHFSLGNNNFDHLSGPFPLTPIFCPTCTIHEIHYPHTTLSDSHKHHFHSKCPDGKVCRDTPSHIPPVPVNPPPMSPEEELPKTQTQPSTVRTPTTTEQQLVDDGDSKTLDSEEIPDIDIRYG